MKDNRELLDSEKIKKETIEREKRIKEIKTFINNTFKTSDGINTLIWLASQCGYNLLSVNEKTEITYLNEGKKFVFLSILEGLDKETRLKFHKQLLSINNK